MNEQSQLIDLNSATLEELMTLPGIRYAMAKRITAARPFGSIEDLRQISGIGSKVMDRLAPLITLSPVEPQTTAPDDTFPVEEVSAPPIETAETMPEVITGEIKQTEALPEATVIEAAEAIPDAATGEPAHPLEVTPITLESPFQPTPADTKVETTASELKQPVTPAPNVENKPAAQPVTTNRPSPSIKSVTQTQAIGMTLAGSILSIILSAGLVLGLLSMLNGGLHYANPSQLNTLGGQVNAVKSQTAQITQELQGLRARLDNLEGLAGRVGTIEKESKLLRSDLDKVSQKTEQLDQQVTNLNSTIKELQTFVVRFQAFLDGLRQLLEKVAGTNGS